MDKSGIVKAITALSIIVFISCAGSGSSTNKSSSDSPPETVVGKVGSTEISYSEVQENYLSGSPDKDYTLEELTDFLPVYLDYRAKILAAEEAGYYEKESLQEELALYSKQAAYAYWMDRKIRPTKFQEYKERFNKEMKSSHVLIALDPEASPEDTLEVYNRIMEARNEFLNGATITELNEKYSSRRNGQLMGGDLPWFSVGTTVQSFENALYNLEVGEISMPVRTQFGYHIIHLENSREKQPDRRLYHIYFRPNTSPELRDSAYNELVDGMTWDMAVREFSDDQPSTSTEGLIGWINSGSRYDPAFIDTVMSLDPTEEFTEPIQTAYGFHIFRIDSVRGFDSQEQKDEFIMSQLENSNSFSESNSFVVNWLQTEYESRNYLTTLNSFVTHINTLDTTRFNKMEPLPSSIGDSLIYKFDEWKFTASDYLNYLSESRPNQRNVRHDKTWYESFKDAMVDDNLTAFTLKVFPEFENQVDSYKKGLVVYQINEDSVWSTATIDSTLLINRYKDNPETYSYDTRYHYYLLLARQDSSLNKARDFIVNGNPVDSLRKQGYKIRVLNDSTSSFQGEPYTRLDSLEEKSFSEIFKYNNQNAIFYLAEILEPRRMTFDEAFNRIVSDYQPIREEIWLNNLRKRFSIESYPDQVEIMYQQENQKD